MVVFMNKFLNFTIIKNLLSKLSPRKDRLQHFFYGFFLFKIALFFVAPIIALAIIFIIAFAIEIKDIKTSGFDVIDILFTVLTGLILVLW